MLYICDLHTCRNTNVKLFMCVQYVYVCVFCVHVSMRQENIQGYLFLRYESFFPANVSELRFFCVCGDGLYTNKTCSFLFSSVRHF